MGLTPEAVELIKERNIILKEMGAKIVRQDELTCQVELPNSQVVTIWLTTGTWIDPSGEYHRRDWDGVEDYLAMNL